MTTFRETHPELFFEKIDSKGRATLLPLAGSDGKKRCGNCGDELTSSRAKAYCGKDIHSDCIECGKGFSYRCDRHAGSREFCGSKCSNSSAIRVQRVQDTVQERYGVNTVFSLEANRKKSIEASQSEEAQKKREATMLERYGATSNLANPELNAEYRRRQLENNDGKLAFNTDKQKATMLERYGVDHPMKVQEFREKALETQRKLNGGVLGFNTPKQRETMFERYGSAGSLGSKEIFEKQKATMLERYGVERPSQHPEFLKKALSTIIENNGRLFGLSSPKSKLNTDFGAAIHETYNVDVIYEKLFDGIFVDIYIPQYNLAIDLNPTVTHNSTLAFACLRAGCEQPCETHSPVRKTYHQKRALKLAELGVRYLQVYDWDDADAIERILNAKLGAIQKKISARKLELKTIAQSEANAFLKEHHIQGGLKKQTHCYALAQAGELLAVATFGPSRFGAKEDSEWLRFAVKSGYRIHGGAGAIFKRFLADSQAQTVVSYLDLSHTNDSSFMGGLGFVSDGVTSPDLWWHRLRGSKAHSNSALMRIGADRLLGTTHGSVEKSGLRNEDIMLSEGWLKVYRAGNLRMVWRR